MRPRRYPPLHTPYSKPLKQPHVLPFSLDPSCSLALFSLRDNKWFDYSGNGNSGTFNSSVMLSSGRYGPTLYFTGSEWLALGNDQSFNVFSAFTLVAWINKNGSGHRVILSRGRGPSSEADGWEFSVDIDSKIRVSTHSSPSGGVYTFDLKSDAILDDNIWYCIIFTFDGTTGILYINGVNDNSSTGYFTSNTYNGFVGRRLQGSYFTGFIDLVLIFNRAFKKDEPLRMHDLQRVY